MWRVDVIMICAVLMAFSPLMEIIQMLRNWHHRRGIEKKRITGKFNGSGASHIGDGAAESTIRTMGVTNDLQ